jgi:hypothetical protein
MHKEKSRQGNESLTAYFESSDRWRQKAEPLRDWRRSSVLLHMLLVDLGQRILLVPLPE